MVVQTFYLFINKVSHGYLNSYINRALSILDIYLFIYLLRLFKYQNSTSKRILILKGVFVLIRLI